MKFGVLSDTHWGRISQIDPTVIRAFQNVDAILHAGDLVDVSILQLLERFRPIYAVYGNCDNYAMRAYLPRKRTIDVESFKIGIIHGWRRDINYLKDLSDEFENIDIVVFGHSHRATNVYMDGVLFFNPGSPTYPRDGEATVGILEIGARPFGYHIAL